MGGSTPNGIIYDERFQQLSTNIFDKIENCQMADPQCNIGLVTSTLAAHSFNFVATNVGGGLHPLKVTWEFQCTDTNGNPTTCSTAYVANTARLRGARNSHGRIDQGVHSIGRSGCAVMARFLPTQRNFRLLSRGSARERAGIFHVPGHTAFTPCWMC